MKRHVRDQVVEAVRDAVAAIPGFMGRVYREGSVDWDEKSYPTAIVFSGPSSVTTISDVDGYQMERRTTQVSVSIGVREYLNEDVTDALSDIVSVVEDEIVALEDNDWAAGVEVEGLSPVIQRDDDDGGIAATVLTVTIEFYTQHGNSGEFIAR